MEPHSATSPAVLTVLCGSLTGQKFPLEGKRVRIGRDPGCDITLPGRDISRVHVTLEREGKGSWSVVDRESKFGTTVNSEKVQKQALRHDDKIGLGSKTLLLFQCDGPAPATLTVEDVAAYAAELDATVDLRDFLGWLRDKRPGIASVGPHELRRVAQECLYEFAHQPREGD